MAASSLLTAAYILPVLHAGWFREPTRRWPAPRRRLESRWMLVVPPLATAVFAVGVGLVAGAPFSPRSWAVLIVEALLAEGPS